MRGIFNWIHGTGNAERAFAFYKDVFGIELARSPFAGSAAGAPEPIRPAAQAGSDPLVWDLTNTHGSRFRTGFYARTQHPVRARAVGILRHRAKRPSTEPWDPGASTLIFSVRDLDAIAARLNARDAIVVTPSGVPITTPGGRAMLVRDPDGCLIEVRQGEVIETSIEITGGCRPCVNRAPDCRKVGAPSGQIGSILGL